MEESFFVVAFQFFSSFELVNISNPRNVVLAYAHAIIRNFNSISRQNAVPRTTHTPKEAVGPNLCNRNQNLRDPKSDSANPGHSHQHDIGLRIDTT